MRLNDVTTIAYTVNKKVFNKINVKILKESSEYGYELNQKYKEILKL